MADALLSTQTFVCISKMDSFGVALLGGIKWSVTIWADQRLVSVLNVFVREKAVAVSAFSSMKKNVKEKQNCQKENALNPGKHRGDKHEIQERNKQLNYH